MNTKTYLDVCFMDSYHGRRTFCVDTVRGVVEYEKSVKSRGDRVIE